MSYDSEVRKRECRRNDANFGIGTLAMNRATPEQEQPAPPDGLSAMVPRVRWPGYSGARKWKQAGNLHDFAAFNENTRWLGLTLPRGRGSADVGSSVAVQKSASFLAA